MATNWDEFTPIDDTPAPQGAVDWSAFTPVEDQKSSTLRRAADVGISVVKGAIAVPEAAVGLLNIPTGGRAGKWAEAAGFRTKEAKAFLDEQLSPEQQAANKAVSDAEGFGGTIAAALQNPSVIAHTAIESIPSMAAGGLLGRGIAAAGKVAPWLAGAAGEGVIGAGSAAESIRQNTGDGLLTAGQAGAALASGAGTAAFGAAGGRLAQKLGIADVDTLLAGGGSKLSSAGVAKRIAAGGISEGVFEELPQSAQEQIWQNAALDRPLLQGVPEAAGLGVVTGAAMGGIAGGAIRGKVDEPAPKIEDIGAAETVDEAIAAANAVVDGAGDQSPAGFDALTRTSALSRLSRDQMTPAQVELTDQMRPEGSVWNLAERMRQPKVEPTRSEPVLRERDFVPPPSGSFGAVDEFAGMLDQERADVEARRSGLLHSDLDQQIASVDAAVEFNRQQTSNQNRMAVLDTVLESEQAVSMTPKQLGRTYAAALAAQGFTNAMPTPEETARIERAAAARDAMLEVEKPIPSAPNELVDAVPELTPTPAQSPLERVKNLIGAGYTLQGKQLVGPSGDKLNLSRAELVYAKANRKKAEPQETANAAQPVAPAAQTTEQRPGGVAGTAAVQPDTQAGRAADAQPPAIGPANSGVPAQPGGAIASAASARVDGQHSLKRQEAVARLEAATSKQLRDIARNDKRIYMRNAATDILQTRDAENRQKRSEVAKKVYAKTKQIDVDRDSMAQAIAKLGGIDRASAASRLRLTPEELNIRGHGVLRVFASTGKTMDQIGAALADLGYVQRDEHGKHDQADFEDKLADLANGADIYTPNGLMIRAQEERDRAMGEVGAESADEFDAIEDFADAIDPYADEAEAMLAQYEADLAGDPEVDFGTPMLLTDEEIEHVVEQIENQEAGGGTEEDAGTSAREGAARSGAAQERTGTDQDFALAGETREQGRTRLQAEVDRLRQQKAERDRNDEQERRAREQKEIAQRQDTSAENFQLGQSADESLSGQRNLLEQKRDEYTRDLFDKPLQDAGRADTDAAGRPGAARPVNMDAAGDVPRGSRFATRTRLASDNVRKLGRTHIVSMGDAAAAMSYLGRGAVERFDALVTDKDGKPLAVVGSFKGALTQAAVYPSTIVGEAFRIKGAANIWFAHNHPSGNASLSNADRNLYGAIREIFRGSGIQSQGLFAIAGSANEPREWQMTDGSDTFRGEITQSEETSISVPVIEREYATNDRMGEPITSPHTAREVATRIAAGDSGILLLDVRNRPLGFVPVDVAIPLRQDGRMDALYRAISVANAGASLIVNNGSLSKEGVRNVGALLNSQEVRLLDVIDTSTGNPQSWAEMGETLAASTFFSRGGQESGLTVDDVKTAIAGDPMSDMIDVYATLDDVPPHIRRQVEIEDATDIEGFYDETTNRVGLIASSLESPQRAIEVARHEVIGHYGIENMIADSAGPDEMKRLIRQVQVAEKAGNKVIRDLARHVDETQPGIDSDRRAKEIIAVMAERNIHNSIAKRVLDAIRRFLVKLGVIESDMTDADIAKMLRDAEAYLREQGRSIVASDATPAFSRSGSESANALKALSQVDEIFKFPKSKETDLEQIAHDNIPGVKVQKKTNIPGETRYNFTLPDGKTATMSVRPYNPYGNSVYDFQIHDGEPVNPMDERPGRNAEYVEGKDDVWIDVSLLNEGSGYGARMYNIAATYAHNNGKVFIGDPAGLSDDALRRRPEQMLSSALKFGTTKHLAPHPRQTKGDAKLGVPRLDWVYGDHVGNIRKLIEVNLKNIENAGGNGDIAYNTNTGRFEDSDGNQLSRDDINGMAGLGLGRSAQAGGTTLARYALFKSLLQGEGGRGRGADGRPNDVLESLVEQLRQFDPADSDSALKRIFYSRSGRVGQPDTKAATQSGGRSASDGRKNNMPAWLKALPQETQDAARKAGIWAEQKPLKDRLKELRNTAITRIQQGLFDQFAPLKELGDREYVLARLTKSSDAPLESLLMHGKPFLNDAGAVDVKLEKGGLIGTLQQLQGEHDRFFAWIAGNRAAKLKEQGRENLFTDTDISALKELSTGTMKDGKNRAALYEKVRLEFNGYSRSVLDIAEKSGIINAEDRSIWESDFYVPFYRVMEDEGFKGPKNVSGMVNQYAFKKLKGGTDTLNDLMQNTLRNWSHLLSASLKNQAAAAALGTAEAAGIAVRVPAKQKGSVTILADGKEKHFMVEDPFILDAITSLEWAGWNNPAMKAMQKAKHYLTLGVTISPTFKIRNLLRDQIAAIAVNPVSYNVMNNLAEGWKGTSKESEQYAKMLAGGGLMRFGTFLEDDRAEHMKRLVKKGVAAGTILDTKAKVKEMLAAGWDWWQDVGDRSENITRAAIYKQRFEQLTKDGMSDDEAHLMASFAARDSMDFSLQGQWGSIRFLTQLVPFMNARLQGLYKLGRDGVMPTGRMLAPQIFGAQQATDKQKAMRFGAVTGTVALASIALMLAYQDDEDWQQREEWDRDAYWWFKIGGTAYRIPKPFEIGAIGTIAERGLEMAMNGMDKESRTLFLERMGSMIANTFSMNPIPQLFKPMVDLYANTDSFTGRPIETPGQERLSKAQRIGPNTSATAQALGKVTSLVGLSPVQVDHLVDSYFSWLGAHTVMTVDFAVRPLMGLPETPARRFPNDYLIVGDFAKNLPADQSKYVTKFYEQSKEVQQAMADIRYFQSLGNLEKARELIDENRDKVRLYRLYTQAGRQMSEINTRITRVKLSKMSADEKREKIDRLMEHKNRLAKLTEERRASLQ